MLPGNGVSLRSMAYLSLYSLTRSSNTSVAAKEQANATCMIILFPDQIHRKTHRSRKQHIASNGSEKYAIKE